VLLLVWDKPPHWAYFAVQIKFYCKYFMLLNSYFDHKSFMHKEKGMFQVLYFRCKPQLLRIVVSYTYFRMRVDRNL